MGFLFGPIFHPSFRFAGVPRRELGVRSVFNILGPLCNPAGAKYQALGVADASLAAKMADVLARLGVGGAIVFHAGGGMAELSTSAPSRVLETDGGRKDSRPGPPDVARNSAAPLPVRASGR